MIGHQQVIDARVQGYKPVCVFVEVGNAPNGRPSPERDLRDGLLPCVWTQGATPATADLRFLLGMRVHLTLHSGSGEMFWQWFDAIKAAKPSAIYGVEPDGEVITWQQ